MNGFLEIPEYSLDIPIVYYRHEGRVMKEPHWHQEIEIIYVLEGVLNLGVDDQILHLEKGEIYIINGGVSHSFLSSPGSERLVLQLDPNLVASTRYFKKQPPLINCIQGIEVHSNVWPKKTLVKIQKHLEKIDKEMQYKDDAYQYEVMAQVFSMITSLYREVPLTDKNPDLSQYSKSNQTVLKKLDQVYRYVEENYYNDIQLDDIAAHVGYNPHYFTRFFKENTGKTFVTFLNEYRISKAKWLLATKDYTVSEIAYRSGFNSIQTFYHVFKKQMDMAPLEYRKQFREERKQSLNKRRKIKYD